MAHHSFDTEIAREYGVVEAIILEHFYFWISKNIANEKHFIEGNYWTYSSVRALNEIFGYLTPKRIRNAIENLKDKGLINVGNFNEAKFDQTKWFSLTPLGFSKFVEVTYEKENAENTHFTIWANRSVRNGKPIPYINTDTIYISFNKLKEIVEQESFYEEEIKIDKPNCNENNNLITEIIDYLNSKIGSHYQPTTPKTKRLIMARVKEGFSLNDFEKVIDNMTTAWGNNPKMKQYLRPETLFGTKFESYLNRDNSCERYTAYEVQGNNVNFDDWAKG